MATHTPATEKRSPTSANIFVEILYEYIHALTGERVLIVQNGLLTTPEDVQSRQRRDNTLGYEYSIPLTDATSYHYEGDETLVRYEGRTCFVHPSEYMVKDGNKVRLAKVRWNVYVDGVLYKASQTKTNIPKRIKGLDNVTKELIASLLRRGL